MNSASYFKIGINSGLILIFFFCGVVTFFLQHPMIDFSVLDRGSTGEPSILLDDEEKEWGRFQFEQRDPISFDAIPKSVQNAFIAAEDRTFFEHSGISIKGIVRSFLVNLYHGKIVQGASTITQQLVKLLFLDSKRTFSRKIKEQVLSILIECRCSKEQIFELYVNNVYFGCGIYGIGAAAYQFWKKTVQELTEEDAALLAAIVRNPASYCPLLYPLSARVRRDIILRQMYSLGYITKIMYTQACDSPIILHPPLQGTLAAHYKETLRCKLESLVGKQQLYAGGLRIKTTLNIQLQASAEKIFKNHMHMLKQKFGADIDGAFISLDVKTGEIKTIIGGENFSESQFNRALQARRQEGSVFKPLVYASVIEQGMKFTDIFVDEPLSVEQGGTTWTPQNYTHRFEGPMTLARALAYSNNVISIKALLCSNINFVVELAKRFGIKEHLNPYPSLALGCVDSTLDEVAAMYNVFANGGMYVEPQLISWIKDRWGTKIYRSHIRPTRAISFRVASQVAQVLKIGAEKRRIASTTWLDSESICKTGTTNDSRTCWFVGSTPELTTAIYVGCDNNRPMGKHVFPVHTAYPIWLEFHKKVHTTVKSFSMDSTLVSQLIHLKTGEISSNPNDPDVFPLLV